MIVFFILYIIINMFFIVYLGEESVANGNLFIYPGLVESLRADLNIPGTIIVVALFSIFFAPMLVCYFCFIGIAFCLTLVCKLFKYIFRRRDQLSKYKYIIIAYDTEKAEEL